MMIQELHKIFLKHSVVCTDTRKIINGSIFFALKGENFNGNKFASNAIDQGCAYAVIDEQKFKQNEKYILVENVLETLQHLAKFHRNYWGNFDDKNKIVIGLTGSNGKTTTKELIYSVLKNHRNCLATVGNLNNHIGVPLTLLALKPEHNFAIIEMGANHQGEIATLCEIAQPNYGIITNIGKAHLEGFGGEEGVLKGKGELYNYIQLKGGGLFINRDDDKLISISNGIKNKYEYGILSQKGINGKILENDIFLEMEIHYEGGSCNLKTNLTGSYNAINVMCAFMVGYTFSVDVNEIVKGIELYLPDNSRSQVFKTKNNTLILDAYNANPSSIILAIDNLVRVNVDKKFFILGEMREMGEFAEKEHLEVFNYAVQTGIKGAFVGKEFLKLKTTNNKYLFFENSIEAKEYFLKNPIFEHIILLKGSRGVKLEEIKPIL